MSANEHDDDQPDSFEVIERLRARVAKLEAAVEWAVARWGAEVKNRPMQNIHRRTLDDTWRQVIRHFGGDDRALCGPPHDDILSETVEA